MIHPHCELRQVSPSIGYGIFAVKFIPKGTIVYIKDELEIIIKPNDKRLNNPLYKDIIEKYSYTEPNGNLVLSWDIAKFVNHCCNCNIMSTGYGFEIAIRDIQPGEEVTDEYGLFNSGWEMDLECSKPGCRKKLTPKDIDIHYAEWDNTIINAFTHFNQVNQPLLPYMDAAVYEKLKKYLDTGKDYISVKTLKCEKARSINGNGLGSLVI
jgi:hypothetical protein